MNHRNVPGVTPNVKPYGFKRILKAFLKYGLPLCMSVGLCYVLFHNMDWDEVVRYVREDCDFNLLLLSCLLGVAAYLVRAYRWRIQLRATGVNPPLHAMFYSIVGTYAVNLVFPRLGEVWRCEYISRRQKAPFANVLGSMIADRLADTVTVLLLLVFTFVVAGHAVEGFVERYPHTYQAISGFLASPWTYGVATVLIVVLRWLLRKQTRNRWLLKVQSVVKNLWRGFASIFRMRHKWTWLLLTVLLWGTYFTQLYISFMAFGLTSEAVGQYGWVLVLVCFVLSSVSMGIPSNGGIGPYQIAIIFGFGCFMPDIDAHKIGALASVILGAQTLLVIVCGLFTFAGIAYDNRQMAKASSTAADGSR